MREAKYCMNRRTFNKIYQRKRMPSGNVICNGCSVR